MALDRITLSHFRNHAASALDDTRQFNLLIGENGAGKTNVLEALSLFAPGRALRGAGAAEMAGNGGDGSLSVGASLIIQDQEAEPVRLGTFTSAEEPGRRKVRINGALSSSLSLGEWLSIGWLTPAMDRIFMDSAGSRRRFLDRLTLALRPDHARIAAHYERSLRSRGRLLADEAPLDDAWMDALEAQMAEFGALLVEGREATLAALSETLAGQADEPFAKPLLSHIAGAPASREEFAGLLRENRGRERAAGRNLFGPHKGDFTAHLAAKNMEASQCSTGEQKAMLIAIILAHSALASKGRPSLLLLDEIAAHLDPVRRAALFNRLREGGAQIWLTGTEAAPFADIAGEAAVWQVAGGALQRVS